MSLGPGLYVILSNLPGNLPIGRAEAEDLSLGPKAIILQPPGVQPSVWLVEKLDDGHYTLRVRNDPVGAESNLLWAFLTGNDQQSHWNIGATGQQDAYLVRLTNGAAGLELPEVIPETQVAIRQLVETPPTDNQVFIFRRILMD
ncbi:hypothetical protein FRB93_003903 [Tulasnella sp. JGI-2019a]|nr:hypothetical protein FRB93_003903 [Tulasnella sp. JGI-2019a]